MRWFVFGAAVLAASAAPDKAGNRPYVQSGPDGVIYARCIPAGITGSAGRTEVYRVETQKVALIATYGWYAPEGVTLGWSPTAGRVAVMARRAEPAAELSFYLRDTRLASCTVDDLGKLGVEVGKQRDTTGPTVRAEFRVLGCEQVPGTNDYLFVIESKGKRLAFDILTGKPRTDAGGSQ
jgi:hypothetical protein